MVVVLFSNQLCHSLRVALSNFVRFNALILRKLTSALRRCPGLAATAAPRGSRDTVHHPCHRLERLQRKTHNTCYPRWGLLRIFPGGWVLSALLSLGQQTGSGLQRPSGSQEECLQSHLDFQCDLWGRRIFEVMVSAVPCNLSRSPRRMAWCPGFPV